MAITASTLVELIESTIEARHETDKQIQALRRELEGLEVKRDQLLQEEQGYRFALARRFPDEDIDAPNFAADSAPGSVRRTDDFLKQTRADAVEAAVRSIADERGTASPAAIEEFLRAGGRDDTRDAIGAALAYLNRTDRVVNVARGQWQPRDGA
ncbi:MULTISPECIES: hypothetical protein [unclassified Agromyces]|uniref:hypothetical protein n=1 Tax=unclassified Agromyces TaxID=2639701 RepID=UPI0030146F7C